MALVSESIRWRDLEGAVDRDGFAFLAGWRPDLSSNHLISDLTSAVRFEQASASHNVTPRNDAPPNTYSGIYGLNDFPAHSDMAHWPEPRAIYYCAA
jgi:L-asparagine oxygenase